MTNREKIWAILKRLKNGESLACEGFCLTPHGDQIFWHHHISGNVQLSYTGLIWLLRKMCCTKTFEVETVAEYERRTGSEFRYSLYSKKELDEAYWVIRERILEVLRILGKRANLIAYMINPRCTAVGAQYSYNEDTVERFFYEQFGNRKDLEYDGNAGYTFLTLARMIKNGEL